MKERQKAKFQQILLKQRKSDEEIWVTNVSPEEKQELQSKWVVNLSDRTLSADERSLLQRGLNFSVTPSTVPTKEYVIGVESACRLIGPGSKQAERLRSDCVRLLKTAQLPTSNITRKEQAALTNLAKDENIMVLPADKGRAVVVLNTKDYQQKATALLSDTKTYKILPKDPTTQYTSKVVSVLKDIKLTGAFEERTYRQLYPTSCVVPRFYGLPKVHKRDVPLRPIVASRGSITYETAKFVARILAPLVGKNGFSLKNSSEMVRELRECTLDETDVLVSYDVTALFTSVPVDQSLDIILARLEADTSLSSRTSLSATQVRDLLAVCLKTTYFLFQGTIYAQVEGAAMGSPVSPIVANLFMEWFEESAIRTFPYELSLWRRYVDDTIVALCDSLIEDFTTHLNAQHPAIKFTREEEAEDGTLPMLDALTKREPSGRMSFTVYRKPTHTDQYLQFDSNQPLQHKLGVVRTLYHRAQCLISNEEDKLKEIDHLQKVLSISGYTRSAWVTATRPCRPRTRQRDTETKKRGYISLPYIGHCSDAIARTIRKAGVAVHLRPYNSIRSRLVHPKDKVTNNEKAGLVYHIKCGDCDATYVGETERNLRKRIAEHHRPSSPIGSHMDQNQHTFQQEEVSVLHQEPDWFRRGVAEAIHIAMENPVLNRDRGRHTLPAIYREILTCDHPSTSGSTSGSQVSTARLSASQLPRS